MKARTTVALSMLAGIGLGAIAVQGIQAQSKPPAPTYYVAEIEVTNLDGYLKEFLPREQANIKTSGGRILATGTKVATIEGDPPKSRVVVLVWDSIEKFQTWRNSPESREIRAVGDKYAKFRAFTVEGLPHSP
jgi:uncharacterized protein (DUF1330 family)